MIRQVLYFAWVRERIGVAREPFEGDAETPADLIRALCQRDARYAAAFADLSAIRVAIDQELADMDTPLGTAREIAFFPPMTGG